MEAKVSGGFTLQWPLKATSPFGRACACDSTRVLLGLLAAELAIEDS